MNNYLNLGKILNINSRPQEEVEYILNDKYYRAYMLIREYINNHAQMRKGDFNFLNAQLDTLESLIDSISINCPEKHTMIVRYLDNFSRLPKSLAINGDVLYTKILGNHDQRDLFR